LLTKEEICQKRKKKIKKIKIGKKKFAGELTTPLAFSLHRGLPRIKYY
jgi:hypothetical protein